MVFLAVVDTSQRLMLLEYRKELLAMTKWGCGVKEYLLCRKEMLRETETFPNCEYIKYSSAV